MPDAPHGFNPAGTLRVLGYDYEVRGVTSADAPREDGTSDLGRALIRVDVERAPDHVRQVALHEILHAVDDATDTGLRETQVMRLARGLYAVCRDNPDYMRRLLFGVGPVVTDKAGTRRLKAVHPQS